MPARPMVPSLKAPALIDPPREHIEAEVARRLAECGPGAPGISMGARLTNGFAEVIYRDASGDPIGVVGFCFGSKSITDFCVRQDVRRRGIATQLCDWVKEQLGSIASIRQPFTKDGLAFGDAWLKEQR